MAEELGKLPRTQKKVVARVLSGKAEKNVKGGGLTYEKIGRILSK